MGLITAKEEGAASDPRTRIPNNRGEESLATVSTEAIAAIAWPPLTLRNISREGTDVVVVIDTVRGRLLRLVHRIEIGYSGQLKTSFRL
jgi:hypothetical protein